MMWAALFQQKPAPEDGDYFKAEWIKTYDVAPDPETLRIYGASDFAVTADGGDFTVHGVLGLDPTGKPYLLDMWRKQASSDVWVEALCDLIMKWKPMEWAFEKGQIASGVGPYLDRRQTERRAYCVKTSVPDAWRQGGQGAVLPRLYRASRALCAGAGALVRGPAERKCLSFPAGRNDDIVDMLGLLGQLTNKMLRGMPLRPLTPRPAQGPLGQDCSVKTTANSIGKSHEE